MTTIAEEIDRLRELFLAKTGGIEPNQVNVPTPRMAEFMRTVYVGHEAIAAGEPVYFRGMKVAFQGPAVDVLRVDRSG